MTFRIDSVSEDRRAGNAAWRFVIKGFQGRGIYCALRTDESGRGLCVQAELMGQFTQLLSFDDFAISVEASRWDACKQLALALTKLGWGPQVYD